MIRIYVYNCKAEFRESFVEYSADVVPREGEIFRFQFQSYTVKWVEWEVTHTSKTPVNPYGEPVAVALINVEPNR
jgi:hypothetical protein